MGGGKGKPSGSTSLWEDKSKKIQPSTISSAALSAKRGKKESVRKDQSCQITEFSKENRNAWLGQCQNPPRGSRSGYRKRERAKKRRRKEDDEVGAKENAIRAEREPGDHSRFRPIEERS